MKSFIFVVTFYWGLSSCIAFCQYNTMNGPVAIALSGCEVGSQHNVWGNPANHAFLPQSVVALGFEGRYNIPQLSVRGINSVFLTDFGHWGSAVSQFGYHKFSSTHYSGSFARLYGKNVAAALQLNFRNDFQNEYGHATAFYTNWGLVYSPSKQTVIGVHVFNPEQAEIKYGSTSFNLPSFYRMGLKWQILSHTAVMAESTFWLDNTTQLSVAMESVYKELLFIRLGYHLLHKNASWGLGVKLKSLQIDSGFSYQLPLGMVSSVGLSYYFGKSYSR